MGVSAWYLRDETKGDAYAYEGLVKSGPASTGLSSFTGTARFNIERPTGWVGYLGANFHHNIDFRTGRFGASGFAMYNLGRFRSSNPATTLNPKVDISGLSANLELLYNYGRTSSDLVTLEGMFSTGDKDLNDGRYTSAFTLNQYGIPGAVWFNHKMMLLFPFTSTANNYTGAVSDSPTRASVCRRSSPPARMTSSPTSSISSWARAMPRAASLRPRPLRA